MAPRARPTRTVWWVGAGAWRAARAAGPRGARPAVRGAEQPALQGRVQDTARLTALAGYEPGRRIRRGAAGSGGGSSLHRVTGSGCRGIDACFKAPAASACSGPSATAARWATRRSSGSWALPMTRRCAMRWDSTGRDPGGTGILPTAATPAPAPLRAPAGSC